jgi:hypothetical protein
MARMNEHMACLQELYGVVFSGAACGKSQYRVPPAIRIEEFPSMMLPNEGLQVRAIFPHASQNLWLQRAALLQ